MKNTGLLFLVLLFTVVNAVSQNKPTFETLRNDLLKVYTRQLPDGGTKVSKQFRRWEWFWEPRLLPDGTLPTGELYLKEVAALQARKDVPNAQAAKVWKEVGPFAPDLPGQNNVWNGIGRVNCMAFHPSNDNTFWIGSAQGGLWKTTNGGGDWVEVPFATFPQTGLSDVEVAPSNAQVLYVATGDVDASLPGELSGFPGFSYGVIKSTDGGSSWKQTGLSMTPDQNGLVSALWIDPANENIVIAATFDGMMKTTNGGSSWSRTSTAGAFRDVVSVANSSTVLFASTFALRGGAQIYRSEDGGSSWALVQTIPGANRIRLATAHSNTNVVGAVASDANTNGLEGVYYSNNQGKTFAKRNVTVNLLGWQSSGNDWQNGGQGFYDLAITIDPKNDKYWLVGGVNVWRSSDAGSTWSLANHWVGQGAPWVHADHHDLEFHPRQNRLYDCNDGGIARSTDRGVTWRDISTGLSIQQYYGLAVTEMNSTVTLAGAQDNGTARTIDGESFYHVLDGDGMATAIDYFNPGLMYGSQPYGVFYRSTNSGNGWRGISNAGARGEQGGGWVSPIIADPNKANTLYIGYTQVHKSTDAGTSWTRISQLDASSYLRNLAVAPGNSNYLWAGYMSSLYRTTNGGTSWSPVSGVSGFIQDIEIDPSDPNHYWVCFGGFSSSSKVLEIQGNKVTNITGVGIPNVPVNAIEYQGGTLKRLFIGTDVGVFVRDGESQLWEPYGTGLAETIVSGMELIEIADKLRVSTYGRGVWEVDVKQCIATTPTITASGPTTFCQGDSVVLTASDGFDSYHWSDGRQGKSIVINSSGQSGSYSVSVVDSKTCKAVSKSVVVTVNKVPAKPFISLRGTDTLRATSLGGSLSYQWYMDGDKIAGATERTVKATKSGAYSVVVTNSDGCSVQSDSYVYTGTSVHEQPHVERLVCWPNPTQGTLQIQLPDVQNLTIKIVSIAGETVYEAHNLVGANVYKVDLSQLALASGSYLVQVGNDSSNWSDVIIKR